MNYKGMDKDMKCRGFQYEIGGEYEEETAVVCQSGFHACEYPLDVFNYYSPATSRFFRVNQSGMLSKDEENTKVASTKIKIVEEVGISELVEAAVEYTNKRCTQNEGDKATGDRSAASATGYQGAASATGDQGAASATGYQGTASATGDRSAASATGDQGAASATGCRSAASVTGYQGAASATGCQGAASATGDRSAASATGDQGSASATGCQGAASATGDRSAASVTGYQGAASATGKSSVALAAGILGEAKGALGCAIFLVERGEWDGETFPILYAKAAIVDGDTVKPNTWYTLENGDLVEVKE